MPNLRAAAHRLVAYKSLATLGEVATYLPKSSGARTITVCIDQASEFIEQRSGKGFDELLRVLVLKDKDNATYGGIDAPQIGDGLQLARDGNAAKGYSWNGHKRDETAYAWVLTFVRSVPHQIGGNR